MKRSKRRQNIRNKTLYLAFAASLFLTFDIYSGDIFKGMLEQKFNNLFSDNLKLSIGRIEGSVFRDIVSSDVSISHPDFERPFKLERIEIPYRIWYPIAKKFKINIYPRREERLIVFFGQNNPFINGHLSFEGSFEDLVMQGALSIFGEERNIVFDGDATHIKDFLYALGITLNNNTEIKGLVDFPNKTLSLDLRKENEIILINVFFTDENKVLINAGLKHVNFKGVDIVGELTLTITYDKDAVRFDAIFKNVILNYSPFKDIEIHGAVLKKRNIINIDSIVVGDRKHKDIIKGYGKIALFDKKYLDLFFKIKNLLLEEFILTKYDEQITRGAMNGELRLRGPFNKIETRAHFDVQQGRIQALDFESLIATLKGQRGLISVEDGRIIKEEGYFILSGEIDFGKWSSGKTFDRLKIETDQHIAVWNGWEISKRFQSSKVKAQKKLAKDITFSFETYANKDLFRPNRDDEKDEIGVEYKIHKNDSINVKLKEEESFIGLQHKVKF